MTDRGRAEGRGRSRKRYAAPAGRVLVGGLSISVTSFLVAGMALDHRYSSSAETLVLDAAAVQPENPLATAPLEGATPEPPTTIVIRHHLAAGDPGASGGGGGATTRSSGSGSGGASASASSSSAPATASVTPAAPAPAQASPKSPARKSVTRSRAS